MLQEVTATMSVVGDTKDLMAFMYNHEPIAETLRGFGLEMNEGMNVDTRQSDEMDFWHDANYGARERPKLAVGVTPKVETVSGRMFVTVNVDEDWRPFEIFLRVGKCGEVEHAHLEGLARMVSYCLRIGGQVEGIIDQLKGITSEPVWDRGVLVRSAEDGVALVLQQVMDGEYDHLLERMLGPRPTNRNAGAEVEPGATARGSEVEPPSLSVQDETVNAERPASPERTRGVCCVKCSGKVVFQEGCMKCLECGYSKCD